MSVSDHNFDSREGYEQISGKSLQPLSLEPWLLTCCLRKEIEIKRTILSVVLYVCEIQSPLRKKHAEIVFDNGAEENIWT
jgi:hypothetical protein